MRCGTRDGYRSGAIGWTSSALSTPVTVRRRMDVADFRRLGYLQEVNRLLLHRSVWRSDRDAAGTPHVVSHASRRRANPAAISAGECAVNDSRSVARSGSPAWNG